MLKDYATDKTMKPGVALLEFWGATCGPCKMLKPVLAKVAEEYDVTTIQVEGNEELAKKWNIRNMPTMFVLKVDRPVKDMGQLYQIADCIKQTISGTSDASRLKKLLKEAI